MGGSRVVVAAVVGFLPATAGDDTGFRDDEGEAGAAAGCCFFELLLLLRLAGLAAGLLAVEEEEEDLDEACQGHRSEESGSVTCGHEPAVS